METKKETKGTITPSISKDSQVMERYFNFCKDINAYINALLQDLDDQSFTLNKKAVKEAEEYFKSNSMMGKCSTERSLEIFNALKGLSKKQKNKYRTGLSSYDNIKMLSLFDINQIPGRSMEFIEKMFKTKNTLQLDYNKLEVRLLGFYSGDEAFKECLKTADDFKIDFYSKIASIIFELPYEQCLEYIGEDKRPYAEGKDRRNLVKLIVLYMIYGNKDVELAGIREDIFKYLNIFKSKFPKLNRWVNTMRNYKKTYVQDIFGNCKPIREFNSSRNASIATLFQLTKTSIHKMFLKRLAEEITVNAYKSPFTINIPLLDLFIIESKGKDISDLKLNLHCMFFELFSKYGLKLDIE